MKSQTTNINDSNIELYILQLKEGTLTDAEREDVEHALGENKDWQQLADMYDPSLQLPGYPHLIFSDKEKLRSIAIPVTNRTRFIPLWSRVAAVIAIVVLAILFIRISIGDYHNNNILTSNNIETTIDTTNIITPINPTITPLPRKNTFPSKSKSPKSEPLLAEKKEETSFDQPDFLYTDNLITFIDDDSSYNYTSNFESKTDEALAPTNSSSRRNGFTDKLITFYDDPLPHEINNPYTPKPVWQSAVDDWKSNIQLARLELHANTVNSLCKLMKSKN